MSTQILEKQDITPEISDKFMVYLKTLHCSLNTTQFKFHLDNPVHSTGQRTSVCGCVAVIRSEGPEVL